jgi:hypothetical protein
MKFKFPLLYAAWICAATVAMGASGPRMTFATNEYNFGKVIAGELVNCVFIATNTGDEILVISNVAPGCHCTTVGDWTKAHQIEPGKTGEIPLQLNTRGLQGAVNRTVKVTSNDKLLPLQMLTLKGTVVKAIKVTPEVAFLHILPDATSNSTVVVHITNELDQPLTLSDPVSASKSFKAELKTITAGQVFEMTVTAIPPFAPGRTTGTISVKTSFTNMPVISVTAYAMVNAPPH